MLPTTRQRSEPALPTLASAQIRPDAHLVQFYDRDEELAGRVAGYLRVALEAGDLAVVVATPTHRAMFAARIAEAGVDLDLARSRGALVELDAAATLARIQATDVLSAEGFDDAVGSVIRGAVARGRRVQAFGEMVALLWEAGSIERALELEQLWNRLRDEVPFTLFCAYPNWLTQTSEGVSGFVDVCSAHSEVVGAPSLAAADAVRRFPKSPAAPRAARRFVSDWLAGCGHADLVDTAQLAVSELATNAVVHAGSDFTVSLTRSARAIRIAVADASPRVPEVPHPDVAATHGRGRLLVESLSTACGHDLVDGGKVVWADVSLPEASDGHAR
jgi:anti-sigma regulatory factor (Ser/Thr protein kinase)